MKQFLKFLETAKRGGVYGEVQGKPVFGASLGPKFWDAFEETQPIVFSNEENTMIDEDGKDPESFKFDAPFKNFSVEMMDGPICIPYPKDEKTVPEEDTSPGLVYCTVAMEPWPGIWQFLSLCYHPRLGGFYILKHDKDSVVAKLVNRLNKEQVGCETVRERIRFGSGKFKKVHTIRRIVHVRPKNSEMTTTHTGRTIDWTHRFFVRGHWRKCTTLGKDREGNYCVSGHTWVTEHIRGPEEAPLISKTRLVTR